MIKDFKTTLLFTTRGLKDSEIAYLKSKSNVIPSVFPIGYDGLAFIVNKNNNDTCFTVNDLKGFLRERLLNGMTSSLVLREVTLKLYLIIHDLLRQTSLLTLCSMERNSVKI